MTHLMLGMLAETFLHPGSGQSDGAIDLRVAREAVTGYPFIPGSGMKGAIRAHFVDGRLSAADAVFGTPESAGAVLISDARLLLLPVRSLSAPYLWLTCPLVLERLLRDRSRCGFKVDALSKGLDALPEIAAGNGHMNGVGQGNRVFLEDHLITIQGRIPGDIITDLRLLFHAQSMGAAARLESQLCIVSNADFGWAATNALPVAAHNVLDPVTKASNNLWYEESLPPDTLLYATVSARSHADEGFGAFRLEVEDGNACDWLRIGANETTGHGWVGCCWIAKGGGV